MNTKAKRSYAPVVVSYDIETTNYRDNGVKKAIVYVHTFCVDGVVTSVRTWDEAEAFFMNLVREHNAGDGTYVVVHVHNLPYEFSFIKRHFIWEDVFAIADRHKVIRARTHGLEFRCTLALTNKSLEGVGREVGIEKMVGDLDYELMRHSETPLTEEEIGYIDNDVLILDALVKQRLSHGDTLATMPMTKTGYVRRKVRSRVRQDEQAHSDIKSMVMTSDDYIMARACFSGGYTHANARFAGDVVTDVAPYDLASAYPASIVREQFPVSSFMDIDPDQVQEHLGSLAMMLDVTLEGVECNYAFGAISKSKCVELSTDAWIDNGRVHSASSLRVIVNDVELATIRRNYTIDNLYVNTAKAAVYSRLPLPVVEAVLDLYVKKTTLKGVEGAEIEYAAAKEDINSVYGMMATDPVKVQFEHIGQGELQETPVNVDEEIKHTNKDRNRALFYPWGAWVTAHTRALLLGTIMDLADAGVNVLYCDTDSTYSQDHPAVPEVIAAVNARLLEKNAAAAAELGIDPALFAPVDPQGIAHPIGLFEHDNDGENLDQFKTLGAKRYAAMKNGKFAITVAGLNKKLGAEYVKAHGGMEFFADGMAIPQERSGRLVHTYVDEEISNIMIDYLGNPASVRQDGFVHLEAAPYSLTIGDEYTNFMNLIRSQ